MNTPLPRRLPLTPAAPPWPPLPHIDARLLAAIPFVRGGVVADVGTDHAYLPLLLLLRGLCDFAVATDIHEPPALRAARALSRYGIGDQRAAVLCTDGLRGCESFRPNDVIIFGMGGEMMIHILTDAPWVRTEGIRLILQPMTKQAELRRYLAAEGFATVDETIVCTDRPYQILCAEYDGTPRELSPLCALLGEHNLRRGDALTKQAAERALRVASAAREGKRRAKAPDTSAEDAIIAALQQYLNGGHLS